MTTPCAGTGNLLLVNPPFIMDTNQKKQVCFYCDAIYAASASSIGDHFPVSRRHGGIAAVPCCRECHSLKDRIKLDDWTGVMITKVINDFPKLSRETRIFLAKAMALFQDAQGEAIAK